MSISKVIFLGVEPAEALVEAIKSDIGSYKFGSLADGVSDVPSINIGHPIAMELGEMMTGGDQYTSPLPAIGVETLDDNERSVRMMGGGAGTTQVTQQDIDDMVALNANQRYEQGVIVADEVLTDLQTALTAQGSEPLYVQLQRHLFEVSVKVGIWSEHSRITGELFGIVKAILIQQELSKILKGASLTGQRGLYNWETGRLLYGGEFVMTGTKSVTVWKVDSAILKVKAIEEHWPSNRLERPGETTTAGGKFVPVGGATT